jgi:ferric-dicitrate binding protein FerR (iron transport regulator)
MSDDRLERALQGMRNEDVDAGALGAARDRVWDTLNAGAATQDMPLRHPGTPCAEFGPDLRAYAGHQLGRNRRLLVEDHLSRCPRCRAELAGINGESTVVAMPAFLKARTGQAATSRWTRRGLLAAAAAVFFAILFLGRGAIDGMLAPGGPRATVVSAEGSLYRVSAGSLEAGAAIGDHETIRTGPGARAVLQLADGSTVNVNERTELFVTAAWSGQAIHLQRGDIIVKAAKQRRGHLRVLTRDSIASVKGTIFAVSAGMGGSVVSVVEGSVEVNQPGRERLLIRGQQAASTPALTTSVAQAISWSPDAPYYLELLGSLAKIERELANVPTDLRTRSSMLRYLPAGAMVYGTIPNPDLTIGLALSLADNQSVENATFAAWWNSETGQQLRLMTDRLQSVSRLLGDEIVFCVTNGPDGPTPIVMATVKAGMRAPLTSGLEGLFATAGETPAAYSVSDELMVVSNSSSHLTWAIGQIGAGAGSPFAAAIGDRYKRGVGWLIAIDAPPVIAAATEDDAPPIELAGMIGMKYLFLEQRAPAGAVENEVTFAFNGPRTGMGSWLADAGSGGAAEYLPADVLVAGYVSTREPLQLFEEFTAQITRSEPDFMTNLATVEEKLGAGFVQNLTAALGTEAAVALTGVSTSGPTWMMASLVNNPAVIDSSIQKLVDAFNAELSADEQSKRIVLTQESANGRVWHTMKPEGLPVGITWTYDQGYLVAGSDRGAAERAIATRNGGSPLVWSPAFLGQLPSTAGLHPSAFGWVNAKGALGMLSTLMPSPTLSELLNARDPILVVFDGKSDLIHGASRTRITGMIMDAMLLESLSRTTVDQQTSVTVSP